MAHIRFTSKFEAIRFDTEHDQKKCAGMSKWLCHTGERNFFLSISSSPDIRRIRRQAVPFWILGDPALRLLRSLAVTQQCLVEVWQRDESTLPVVRQAVVAHDLRGNVTVFPRQAWKASLSIGWLDASRT